MLLALLALVFPTAALANSISSTGGSTFNTGTFVSGSITSCCFANPFQVQMVGSINTITLDTSTLNCSGSPITCTFSNGTVDVEHEGATIFTDSIVNGAIGPQTDCIGGQCTVKISANLGPNSVIDHGFATFDGRAFLSTGSPGFFTEGTAEVRGVVPEPSTLEGVLLGIGVIGLAGMTKRKLKLAT